MALIISEFRNWIVKIMRGSDADKTCCDHPNLQVYNHWRICRSCGYVDPTPEYDSQESIMKDTYGKLSTTHTVMGGKWMGSTTIISRLDRDYRGNSLNPSKKAEFRRWRSLDKQTTSPLERKLRAIRRLSSSLSEKIGFKDQAEISRKILLWVARTNYAWGRSIIRTIVAAIFVAATEQGRKFELEMLCILFGVNLGGVRRIVQDFLSPYPNGRRDFPVKLTKKKFIDREIMVRNYCRELGQPNSVVIRASKIYANIMRNVRTDHRPATKAAAAVFLATNEEIPWADLARVSKVKEASLRAYSNRLNTLLNAMKSSKENGG